MSGADRVAGSPTPAPDANGDGGPDPGSPPKANPGSGLNANIAAADDGGSGGIGGPEAGARLFAAGLAALLFSIGGLITVGIRRRRW